MEDRQQLECFARAQILEIDVWDQLARKITLALHAENLILQLYEPATVEPELPQTPRSEQQIEMRQTAERRPRALHTISRFEQRLVVRFAVVRNQHVEFRQVLRQ